MTWEGSYASQGHGMIPNFIPICHFCGIDGHIRPNCFHYIKMRRVKSKIEKKKSRAKMHVPRNDRTNLHEPRTSRAHVPMTTRKESVSPRWIRKDAYFCHVAHSSNFWYLDSGCSRHMTGNKSFFETLVIEEGGCVTFGDGSKKRVVRK